jgi:hypothetical protein
MFCDDYPLTFASLAAVNKKKPLLIVRFVWVFYDRWIREI